jgi:hypothetical protein
MSSFEDALSRISDADFSLPSEVEVAMDDVASQLRKIFDVKSETFRWKRPSLSDVLVVLVKKKRLPDDVTTLVDDIEDILKHAYDEEFDSEDRSALQDMFGELKTILLKNLPGDKKTDAASED